MFGLFKSKKERPVEIVFDYEFSSKVASSLEHFILSCAQNWDTPSEKIKEYSFLLHHSGLKSFQLTQNIENDCNTHVVPLDEIEATDKLNPILIKSIQSGPFVNPSVSVIADEIVNYLKEKHQTN